MNFQKITYVFLICLLVIASFIIGYQTHASFYVKVRDGNFSIKNIYYKTDLFVVDKDLRDEENKKINQQDTPESFKKIRAQFPEMVAFCDLMKNAKLNKATTSFLAETTYEANCNN